MRIIGGIYGGRRLKSVSTPELRPTTDRVRETVFNILTIRMDFAESTVLDLFAGTGALGLEALSRGATHCDFVEKNRKAAGILKENLETLDLGMQGEVIIGDAMRYVEKVNAQYDLIMADPPYNAPVFQKLLVNIMASGILKPEGLFVLEHSSFLQLPVIEQVEAVVQKSFGDTGVTIFRQAGEPE